VTCHVNDVTGHARIDPNVVQLSKMGVLIYLPDSASIRPTTDVCVETLAVFVAIQDKRDNLTNTSNDPPVFS